MNADTWTAHSRHYNGPSGDALTLPMVESAFMALWFPKLDKMIAKKGAPLKVLALACGTGAEIKVLCSRYDKSQMSILATDYSEGMLQMTQSCVERIGKQDMVTTKIMDAMNIEQDSSSFDVVFLILGPMLMPDPHQVFKEIQRVLVPGGWSGFLTPGKMEIHGVMSQAKKEILAAWDRESEFKSFYDLDMMQKWGTLEALRARLVDADFKEVEVTSATGNLNLQRGDQIDKMLTFLFENPGISQMYQRDLTSAQVEQFREKVRAAFRDRYPVSEDTSLKAPFYMTGNAAMGYGP